MRDGVNFGLTSGTAELTTELRGLPLPSSLCLTRARGPPDAFCSARFPPEMPRFVKNVLIFCIKEPVRSHRPHSYHPRYLIVLTTFTYFEDSPFFLSMNDELNTRASPRLASPGGSPRNQRNFLDPLSLVLARYNWF